MDEFNVISQQSEQDKTEKNKMIDALIFIGLFYHCMLMYYSIWCDNYDDDIDDNR